MSTSTFVNELQSHPPGWDLLAEYVLGDLAEMLPENAEGDGLTAGLLVGPFQEWGVPPELICQIELSLTALARQTGFPVTPGRLRIFCQKKVIAGAKAARTSNLEPVEAALPAPLDGTLEALHPAPLPAATIQDHSSPLLNRGWGYFIVDRSGSDISDTESRPLRIDLYLYQEGG